jgi:hypothetical protein
LSQPGADAGNASDNEGDEERKLKKRKRRYQDLQEYLDIGGSSETSFQGLLLRDQKYLRKNLHKVCHLSVKESASKLIKRAQ